MVQLYSKDPQTIHHAAGSAAQETFFKAAVKATKESGASLKICWSGTLVTVTPEMDLQNCHKKWDKERRLAQNDNRPTHPAFCPEC